MMTTKNNIIYDIYCKINKCEHVELDKLLEDVRLFFKNYDLFSDCETEEMYYFLYLDDEI